MKESGQSLFEVVVALAIVTLVVMAIITLASTSIRNSSFARDKSLATRYSQEGTEWLRGQRDSDWTNLSTRSANSPGLTWCLASLAWPGAQGVCGPSAYIADTIFKREAVISFPDPLNLNNIQVDVKTYWEDGQGSHEVKTSTYLANWKI